MIYLLSVAVGVVAGLYFPRCWSAMRDGLLTLAARGTFWSWLWVAVGGPVSEMAWRHETWRRNSRACDECGVRVNTVTQNHVTWGGEGAFCPRCSAKRTLERVQ